jgi:hypothetical protein
MLRMWRMWRRNVGEGWKVIGEGLVERVYCLWDYYIV